MLKARTNSPLEARSPRKPLPQPRRRGNGGAAPGAKTARSALNLVLEALPVGILMVDGAGNVTLVNAQAERILGYGRQELVGRPVEILLPERLRTRHVDDRRGFLMNPTPRRMGAGRDLFALRKDNQEIPVEIGLSPVTTPQGVFVLASIIGRQCAETQSTRRTGATRSEGQQQRRPVSRS